MALRYWVGGSGTWDGASTTNWSATSGGAGGASVPTTADDVFLNGDSGGGTVTLGADVVARIMTMTGFTGTLAFSTFKISLAGNATTVFTGATTFSTSGNKLIELTYTGSTGSRVIATGAMTEANAISFSVPAGSDSINPGTSFMKDFLLGASRANAGAFGVSTVTLYGNLTLNPTNGSVSNSSSSITFAATSGIQTLTSNGVTINKPINMNGVGTTVRLADDLIMGNSQRLTLTNGTFDASNKNLSIPVFTSTTGTVTLSMGSGTWTVTGSGSTAWNCNHAGLTVSPTTANIVMNSASAKTFVGGGKTWPTLTQAGAGGLTISGSSTFANIAATSVPSTITFTSGTTQTVSAFTASGTAGNLLTLNTTAAGSRATLRNNTADVSVSYTSIKDLAATGSANWVAYTTNGNVNAGNNIGWEFVNPGPLLASEYPVTLRSFTERRSF